MMRPLAVIGNVNVDLIVGPVAPWPKAGTETVVDHDDLRVGGQAGNTALAWQALGIDFEIAANIGDDQFGRWLSEAFGARAQKWPVHREGTTLSVGMTHPDGERTFFTTRGHLPRFSLGDVVSVLDGDRLSGGYALLCGSFLTNDLTRDYDAFFDWAEAHRIAVALDTGWPIDGWTEANCAATRGWLSRSELALFNEVEMTTLAGLENPVAAACKIRDGMRQGATAVVKRGPDGAIAIGPDGELIEAAAPRVKVVDTIGAGDVFNAAFLAALAREQPLDSCLSDAIRVASRAISTLPRDYSGPIEFEDVVNERA
jgi:sugar/nucleoside kinase (ribokinase family)